MYDQFDLLSIITTVPIRETVFSIEEEAQIRALKDSELTKPSHCSSNRLYAEEQRQKDIQPDKPTSAFDSSTKYLSE
ncbi:hypothetical protein RB195_003296 [Necator americanus]|uniref:Uncharacterized protein n=1 Tax=Necator americanus TaxID=51031 RepID=A0ABR1DMW4_NECAM